MNKKPDKPITKIFEQALACQPLSLDDGLKLMEIPLHSELFYQLLFTADQLSRTRFANKGENHLHIGLNVEPCPLDCLFCSLTRRAGIFSEKLEFSDEQLVAWAKQGEAMRVDALNLMTTGSYPFSRLLEVGRMLSAEVSVPLVANTRDINHREAEELLKAGFVGAYHAVRLGEGRDTPLDPKKRIKTIKAITETGLGWANCIEPVGPEHSAEELIGLMLLAREHRATYSGVMRRINFPGSPMSKHGMISELEMARLVAISRLIMGDIPKAHCTHEPNSASLIAGANLFFPEVGSSPRDGIEDTKSGRGKSIEYCQELQKEMCWQPERESNCYRSQPAA